MLLFYSQVVYKNVLAAKVAMTDAFKEISKYAVDHGPYIGHYCSEQRLKVRLKLRIYLIYLCSKIISSKSNYNAALSFSAVTSACNVYPVM